MSVRTVTGTINQSDGTPWVAVDVTFKLDTTGVTVTPAGIYPPKVVPTVTDEAGELSVDLWANEEGLTATTYYVSIGGKSSFSFLLPAGASPIDLGLLKAAGLTTVEQDDPIIAVIQAMIDAGGPGTVDLSAYATLASPALTGTPTAPTPANATNTTQIATTAFVNALLTDLIGTAPANLDTLQEIAAQLATDESAVAALITAVSLKANISSLAAVAFSGLKADVGLGNVDNTSDVNAPVSTAQAAADALKANLSGPNAFNDTQTVTKAIGAVSTDAVVLQNTTPATVGAQKWSPRTRWTGQGWATTPVASQRADYIAEVVPAQGAANPTANLVFSSSVNGAAYVAALTVFSNGISGGVGGVFSNSNFAFLNPGGQLRNSAQNSIIADTSNVITIGNASTTLYAMGGATSAYSALKRSAATLQVRLGDDSGYADIIARSVRGVAVAFAALPASPVEGMLVGVTDSSTATWGATITGGGSNHVLAYYTGSAWKVACA